jgi:hypothetical protein
MPNTPATGRPTVARTAEPGPLVFPQWSPVAGRSPTGHRAASMVARATSGETAALQEAPAAAIDRPDGSVIRCTGRGSQCFPSAARVA